MALYFKFAADLGRMFKISEVLIHDIFHNRSDIQVSFFDKFWSNAERFCARIGRTEIDGVGYDSGIQITTGVLWNDHPFKSRR